MPLFDYDLEALYACAASGWSMSRDEHSLTLRFSRGGLWDSTCDAVVLQTYPLSETDRIVIAYTRKYGKLRGVAHGAKRIRSSFSGRLEPFYWIELCGHEKENQELIK